MNDKSDVLLANPKDNEFPGNICCIDKYFSSIMYRLKKA